MTFYTIPPAIFKPPNSFEKVKVSVEALRELCDLQATVLNDCEPLLVEVWKGTADAAAGGDASDAAATATAVGDAAAAAVGDAAAPAAVGDVAAPAGCKWKVEHIENPHWEHLGSEFNTTTSLKRLLTDEDFSHDVQREAQVNAQRYNPKPLA